MDVDDSERTENISIMSPPPKRFHPFPSPMRQKTRVRNPFEAAWAERLHLPVIASPSLFQRPATPQLSSTQIEWTIDEVSSMNPANVEPHETQFHDSPDPEYEAKAQMAISSYFTKHQIVPSPVNCSFRQQRIILAEINGNTPIGKSGRRIRDFSTQTDLSLPVVLPAALEEALRPYFQPQLGGCYAEDGSNVRNHDGSESSNNSCFHSSAVHNTSMRRKLFDIQNIIVWDESRKTYTPKTSKLISPNLDNIVSTIQLPIPPPSIAGKLSDSLDKSSGDLLSPILDSESLSGSPRSPNNVHLDVACNGDGCPNSNSALKVKKCNQESRVVNQTKARRRSFYFNPSNSGELSPIYASPDKPKTDVQQMNNTIEEQEVSNSDFITPAKVGKATLTRRRLTATVTINDDDENDFDIGTNSAKFTPDRSSSPLHSFHSSASACGNNSDLMTTLATESFHARIMRLAVNSEKSCYNNDAGKLGIAPTDDTELGDFGDEDDAMQVSQLSLQNSNLSNSSINSHCDTPTGKRRSASRKNLSQSFSANWPLDDGDEMEEDTGMLNITKIEQLSTEHFGTVSGELIKNPNYLLEITDFISETAISGHAQTNEEVTEQTQQQCGNFYRTDSGFNEMTTCSTSNGVSLLSQQDELSREAFNLNTNEISDTVETFSSDKNGLRTTKQHQKSPHCSTPSKSHNECCLTTTV